MNLKRIFVFLFSTLVITISLYGCGSTVSEVDEEAEMSIAISSPAFQEGQPISSKYTCDDENLSPQLDWSGIPQNAKSLALIMDDPDAPVGTFVHWVLYGMESNLKGLAEGVPQAATVTGVGIQGVNGFRNTGYGGPCPPKGSSHRYYFKLYALDITLTLNQGASKADVEKAMQGHILAQGQLMGTYSRK